MKYRELELKSIKYRKTILEIIFQSGAGHTGGSLSCIDILNVLYNGIMNITPENFSTFNRDHFIQSKGHSVEALYTVLQDCGFFSQTDLKSLNSFQSHFIGHPTRKVPGIEHNTGALGHGLSVAVGMALGLKMDKKQFRVFTLLGDGELSEGSIWEAATSASKYQLDNLIVIIDRNKLQITGNTEEVNPIEPLKDKFISFGFNVAETNGNNISSLMEILQKTPTEKNKPHVIIANTIKGAGVSFIENQIAWHHKVPSEIEYDMAIKELDKASINVQ
ncbi:transketolase [Alphaproteobacteria bacterium]|jgi:transketolase|nr:transketolase [Alphaproteobacteria bacterium]MDB2371181.1 transketolase [Alphaproteobacteria bacterium]|tara:strand:+ start:151 stop:978 length:828 start_codon:yes stop_codon:yes gene_type:complete